MKLKVSRNKPLIVSLFAVVALAASVNASADTFIGDIIAGADFPDDEYFKVENTSAYDLTNIVFTGDGGNGFTGTWNFGTVAAGSSLYQLFPDTSNTPFQQDYDDFHVGGGDNLYTMTALWQGQTITASFSPNNNYTGQFAGFLGNFADGSEADWSNAYKVAVLYAPGAPVPEADQYALMLAGLGLMAGVARHKQNKS